MNVEAVLVWYEHFYFSVTKVAELFEIWAWSSLFAYSNTYLSFSHISVLIQPKNVLLKMKIKKKSSFSYVDSERRQNVTVKLTWLQPVELIWSYIKVQGSLITQGCITKLKLVNSMLHLYNIQIYINTFFVLVF